MDDPSEDPLLRKVITALEDARFKWRTVTGVADQIKSTPREVLQALNKLTEVGLVIRSTIPSKDGSDLYTTRKHYKAFAPLGERLAAAFRNRAD
jgi:predicted transcriptional regulator